MKSRPILFSALMVRTLLDGSKTQTRRVFKGGVPLTIDGVLANKCPYGQVGDQLWVRETHAPQADCGGAWDKWLAGICYQPKPIIHYAADFKPFENDCLSKARKPFIEKWRPSIHMPRWASRITLEITGVRVERLQDISEADALAEGIIQLPDGGYSVADTRNYSDHPAESFASLWENSNGDGSWDLNPWVWVLEFKRTGVPA